MTPDTSAPAAIGVQPEARYVNHFAVGFNEAEIVMDFAQSYRAEPPPPGLRLVMSPLYAKQFLSMLTTAMGEYESTFGALE